MISVHSACAGFLQPPTPQKIEASELASHRTAIFESSWCFGSHLEVQQSSWVVKGVASSKPSVFNVQDALICFDHIAQYLRIYITRCCPNSHIHIIQNPLFRTKNWSKKNIQSPYKTQIPPNKKNNHKLKSSVNSSFGSIPTIPTSSNPKFHPTAGLPTSPSSVVPSPSKKASTKKYSHFCWRFLARFWGVDAKGKPTQNPGGCFCLGGKS